MSKKVVYIGLIVILVGVVIYHWNRSSQNDTRIVIPKSNSATKAVVNSDLVTKADVVLNDFDDTNHSANLEVNSDIAGVDTSHARQKSNSEEYKTNLHYALEHGWNDWLEAVSQQKIQVSSQAQMQRLLKLGIRFSGADFIQNITNYGFTIPNNAFTAVLSSDFSDEDNNLKLDALIQSGYEMSDVRWYYLFQASLAFGLDTVAQRSINRISDFSKLNIDRASLESLVDNGFDKHNENLKRYIDDLPSNNTN